PLRLTASRIEEVLFHAVSACSADAEARGVELRLAPFRSSRETTLDPDRMLQVLQNAIDNAIQHSPDGEVVWIRAREEARVTGVWTIISVEDRGSGFDPSSLPRVFEPFFTRRAGGTGLGLSLVQKIVREHGGTVTARNAPNGGAILEIALRTLRESNV
ncbi:MAG TPA: ATP-binding protein, partial [Thermoanaerobaculia bacterium]